MSTFEEFRRVNEQSLMADLIPAKAAKPQTIRALKETDQESVTITFLY